MKILFVSQYFPPEIEAGAFRVSEISKLFSSYGHKVTVLCGMPNFPTGEIPAFYRKKFIVRESINGVDIVRIWVYPTKNDGLVKRIINYFSFIISATSTSMFLDRFDVVIATSPPLFTGVIGVFISRIKNIPLIFEVRDVWPESAEALGLLTNKWVLRFLQGIEKFIYRMSSMVVVVTKGYIENLIKKGVLREKLRVISNGVDIDCPKNTTGEGKILEKLNVSGKFIVLYAGTHGVSQGLLTLINCANLLRKFKDIVFLLVGEGADKDALMSYNARLKLKNVFFINQIAREKLHKIMACSNLSVVLLKKNPLFLSVVPSKLYESMAFGKPIVLGVEGEAKEILETAKAGICIRSENEVDMKEAILSFYNDRNFAVECGINGREFVEKNYSRKMLAKKYENAIQMLIKDKGYEKH